ncbi:HigA family addiction module antidote protein [Massilia sp. CCM 8733]|uniref:HigA family addiction module antidote protein n=1 Tax=Massilia mucilaginosa TaxID=2609282 RepID=A0ABX0NRF2_9BURK|nr:HigA family addiction module antitoxin [Massilia mucilaginosa]NHZ89380.1 HigA family addiction module antidote protein [Massilia mucilaginosa]
MITMHPGEYLREVYLEPLGMTQSELAKRLQVDKSSVSRVISGKAELFAAMAVRLSQVFDLSAEAWMGMQTAHSLMLARKNLEKMDVDGTELAPAS